MPFRAHRAGHLSSAKIQSAVGGQTISYDAL
jgi:hypothetical protein